MRPDPADGYPGRTYRYTTAGVLYPFGHGLSYSSFVYSKLSIAPAAPTPCDTITVSADVTNTSPIDGEEVVQLYLALRGASVPTPLRALVDFVRVAIPAGVTRTVTLRVTPRLNSLMRAGDYEDVVQPGVRTLYVGGTSALAGLALRGDVTVTGAETPVARCEA